MNGRKHLLIMENGFPTVEKFWEIQWKAVLGNTVETLIFSAIHTFIIVGCSVDLLANFSFSERGKLCIMMWANTDIIVFFLYS